MADVRKVTDDFSVAPQIAQADFQALADAGFALVVNNRPDGEAMGQISNADAETAAEAAGLGYVHIPFAGPPSLDDVDALAAALSTRSGPVLAYCRSGTRSITLWALTQVKTGVLEPRQAVAAAEAAGYDLRGLEPALASLAPA